MNVRNTTENSLNVYPNKLKGLMVVNRRRKSVERFSCSPFFSLSSCSNEVKTRPCVSWRGPVSQDKALCIITRPCVSLVTSRGRSGAMSASAASLLVASLSWRRMPADLSLLILLKERQSQTRQQKLGSKISIVILSKLYSPGELEKGLKFKRVIKNKKFNYLHFILSYYRSISHYAYIIVNFFFYFFHSPLMKVKK